MVLWLGAYADRRKDASGPSERKDTEAAALICSSHFDRILLNTNSIQDFIHSSFPADKMADSKTVRTF